MDTGQFYLHRDGEQYGPYSKQDLENMAQKSELLADDLIWCEGMPDWQSAQALFLAATPNAAVTVVPKARTNKLVAPLIIGLVLIGIGMLWLVLQAASKHQREAIAAAKVVASPTPPPQPLEGPLGMTRQEIAARFGQPVVLTKTVEDNEGRKSVWEPTKWKEVPLTDDEITWRDPKNSTYHKKNEVGITVYYHNGKADKIDYSVIESYSDAVDILETYGNYSTAWAQKDSSMLEQALRQEKLRSDIYPVGYDTTSYLWESTLRHPSYGSASATFIVGSGVLTVETEQHSNRKSESYERERNERSDRFKGL